MQAAFNRPAASEDSPSQIAGASSPAAIRADRFGTGHLHQKEHDDLHDQRDDRPDQAVQHIGRMRDRADQWRHEAEQAEAECDRGGRLVVADELELVVRA